MSRGGETWRSGSTVAWDWSCGFLFVSFFPLASIASLSLPALCSHLCQAALGRARVGSHRRAAGAGRVGCGRSRTASDRGRLGGLLLRLSWVQHLRPGRPGLCLCDRGRPAVPHCRLPAAHGFCRHPRLEGLQITGSRPDPCSDRQSCEKLQITNRLVSDCGLC